MVLHSEMRSNFLLADRLGRQLLEGGRGDVGDDSVEVLALAALHVLDLAVHTHADTAGDALDTLVPQERVQGAVDAVVGRLQQLADELLDLLHRQRSALVEGALLQDLGEVDRHLVRHVVGLAGAAVLEQRGAGHTTLAVVLLRVADALELGLLLGAHLGKDLLPLLVVLVLAGLDRLLASSDESELLLLAQNLTLDASADHC